MPSAATEPRQRSNDDRDLGGLRRQAERIYSRVLAQGDERLARIWRFAAEQLSEHHNPTPFLCLSGFKRIPVTIEEFVESTDFLGNIANVWPTLMPDLRALNPDILVGEEPVSEAFLGGATGIGKSALSRITILYQTYLLTCLRYPQSFYGLDPNTRFVFPLQSVTPDVTRRVLYEPLREMFEAMPYAQNHLDWNRRRTGALELAGGIHIVPLLANVESLLGQAIPGALLDEVNHMRIVEQSVRVAGPRGLGGRYDQAEELYRELSQRRNSRFAGQRMSIGCILVCSSARYQNDFLDRRIREVEESGQHNVVITRHKRYDVVPPERYCGETFTLLVGTERYRSRILNDDDTVPEDARIEQVPIEHLEEFRRDTEGALRNIIGIAVDSITPFIADREKIIEAVERGIERGLDHWVTKPDVVLETDGLPCWIEHKIPLISNATWFVHIDLSKTRDACGIAIVRHLGNVNITVSDAVLVKPSFAVEAAISIKPSPDAELIFSALRGWLLQLVDSFGIDFHSISLDGYQSSDTMQIFRKRGIATQEISVDRTAEPYEYLRECLYEGRIEMVDSSTLRRELVELERNTETGLIDHPPRGTKDVADAVCGAVYAASTSRIIRTEVGYYDSEGVRKTSRDRKRKRPQGRHRPQGAPRR